MPDHHRRVRIWDTRAPRYDKSSAWLERRLFADSRVWLGRWASGQTLEVAIGTGANLPYYSADVELTGVDFSDGMLTETAARANALEREVRLTQADAGALPFTEASFDTVTCTLALCSIPDVPAALTEMLRVLRPGGTLLLVDHVAAPTRPVRAIQRVIQAATVPLEGEHLTRRPLDQLRQLPVTIVESTRLHRGLIERVRAQPTRD